MPLSTTGTTPFTMPYTTTFLKQAYARIPETIARLDAYIQKITGYAYANVHLLSNQVLSRNPHTSDLFRRALFEEPVRWPTLLDMLRLLLAYYANSAVGFLLYLATYTSLRLFPLAARKRLLPEDESLYVIDTFLILDSLLQSQQYEEKYFPGLYNALSRHDQTYVVLPKFYDEHPLTPLRMRKALRVLAASPHQFIHEFELLRFFDLLRIAWFIVRYPTEVLALAAHIPRHEPLDDLFISELLKTISQVTFYTYIRYLTGRRLGQATGSNLKVISWYENQTIDKNFFRGIKEVKREDSFIFGCQCYIAYPPYFNLHVADVEKQHLVNPECILVNGTAYLDGAKSVTYRLGVSFRNPHVFFLPCDVRGKDKCVMFLSYFQELSVEIVNLCLQVPSLVSREIAVAIHPTATVRHLAILSENWYHTNKSRLELFGSAEIVITSESSAAVEAAAVGSSVIIVASQSTFTCNPMLDLGRGELWELVFNAQELEVAYHRLLKFRVSHSGRVQELAERYRTECFVEPTEQNIVRAFDLLLPGNITFR